MHVCACQVSPIRHDSRPANGAVRGQADAEQVLPASWRHKLNRLSSHHEGDETEERPG